MKKLLTLFIFTMLLIGCNKDKTGPSIIVSEDSFCVVPGQDIKFSVEINDEDLKEVNMTAPDLDFIKNYQAETFQDSDGLVDFIFTIDLETSMGNYVIGIEALDNNGNASTAVIDLKVN